MSDEADEMAESTRDRGAREAAAPTDGDRQGIGNPLRGSAKANDSDGIGDSGDVVRLTSGETAPVAQPATSTTRTRRRTTWTARQRDAIDASARFPLDVGAVCAACPTASGRPLPRSTLAAWRRLPGWAAAVDAARSRLEAETAGLEAAVRHASLVAAHEEIRAGRADAAFLRACLAATVPTGEERRAAVLRDFVRSLPDALRSQVAAHIDGTAALESMTDDELAALASGRK